MAQEADEINKDKILDTTVKYVQLFLQAFSTTYTINNSSGVPTELDIRDRNGSPQYIIGDFIDKLELTLFTNEFSDESDLTFMSAVAQGKDSAVSTLADAINLLFPLFEVDENKYAEYVRSKDLQYFYYADVPHKIGRLFQRIIEHKGYKKLKAISDSPQGSNMALTKKKDIAFAVKVLSPFANLARERAN